MLENISLNDCLVEGSYAISIISLVIFINLIVRIFDTQESSDSQKSAGDPFSQLSIAINSAKLSSLCPVKKTYGGLYGRQYYPLASFWVAFQLINSTKWLSNLFSVNDSKISKFLRLKDRTIDNYIIFYKFVSGVVLPIIAQLLIAFVFIILRSDQLPIVVFALYLCSIIVVDSLFERSLYCVSTRNPGLFIYTSYCCMIIYIFSNNLNLSFIHTVSIFSIAFFLTFITIFQVSQRYSQCFVVTTSLLCIAQPFLLPYVLLSSSLGFLLLINIPKANFYGYIKSHIYNRVHDIEWSYRAYGQWRYGLLGKLNTVQLKILRSCAFFHSYVYSDFSFDAFYKKNMMSIFLVFRPIIYGAILLCLNPLDNDALNITLKLFILAAVAPSFLCLIRPFQGYGASDVYVFGNISLILISLGDFWSNSAIITSNTFISSALEILLIIDCLSICISYCCKQLREIKSIRLKKGIYSGDIFQSMIVDGVNSTSIKAFNLIAKMAKNHSPSNPLRIVTPSVHLQHFAETCENYIVDESGELVVKCDFKLIDTPSYSFYNDWQFHSVRPEIVLNKIKPDVTILDISKPRDRNFLYILKKHNIKLPMLRIDDFAFLIMNRKLLTQTSNKK